MRTIKERIKNCSGCEHGHLAIEDVEIEMKEAREDYAKEFAIWSRQYRATGDPDSFEKDGKYYTTKQLIDLFNDHLSAIEAEKERGKG